MEKSLNKVIQKLKALQVNANQSCAEEETVDHNDDMVERKKQRTNPDADIVMIEPNNQKTDGDGKPLKFQGKTGHTDRSEARSTVEQHGRVLNVDSDGSCVYHSLKMILVAEGLIVTSLTIAQLHEMILNRGENSADLFLGKNLMGDDTCSRQVMEGLDTLATTNGK